MHHLETQVAIDAPAERIGLPVPAAKGTWNVKISSLMCALFAASAIAGSQTPRLEVQGVPLGATVEELQQAIPLFRCYGATCTFDPAEAASARCGPVSSDPAVLGCYGSAGSKYAFASVHGAEYTAYLNGGRVGEFRVTFPTAHADEVVSALEEKYGTPSDAREVETENQLGARFVNRVVSWHRADGEITVERRAADVDTGLATLIADWYARATANDKAIELKPDAKGR